MLSDSAFAEALTGSTTFWKRFRSAYTRQSGLAVPLILELFSINTL